MAGVGTEYQRVTGLSRTKYLRDMELEVDAAGGGGAVTAYR